jgi:hypothetical protein
MRELTEELIAFLDQHISLLAAGRDRELRPSITRAVGFVPGADRKSFTAFLSDRPGASLLAVLEKGAPFALIATHVPTLRSMQMKGVITGIRPASEAERPLIEACTDGFAADLADTGYPLSVVRRLVNWPATAIEVALEAVFDQTPGPGAGRPAGTA